MIKMKEPRLRLPKLEKYVFIWDGCQIDIHTYIKKLEETIKYADEIIIQEKRLIPRNPYDAHSHLPIENAVKNIKENK